MYGKQTLALVRKDSKLAPIVATPNFNSHLSVIPPKEKDDIEVQFDHSQIYLYELDSNKQPSKRPRHCLPYAVVTWLKLSEGSIPPSWPHSFLDLGTEQVGLNGSENTTNQELRAHDIKQEKIDDNNGHLDSINQSFGMKIIFVYFYSCL
jgi:hypothetical protein